MLHKKTFTKKTTGFFKDSLNKWILALIFKLHQGFYNFTKPIWSSKIKPITVFLIEHLKKTFKYV